MNESKPFESVAALTVRINFSGTLVMGAAMDHRCALGMILGTGCNGCYIEKVSRIEKWQGKHTEDEVSESNFQFQCVQTEVLLI